MNNELDLSEKLKNIINNSNKDSLENNELLKKCREIIIEYKNKGLTQYEAYDKIFILYKLYDEKNMEKERDFTADVLDIICGNIGNKEWSIWDEYYSGNKI